MNKLQFGIFLFFVSRLFAQQESRTLDLQSFVNKGLANEPIIQEKNFETKKAKLQKQALRNSAIIPKLEVSFAVGPAPRYSITHDADGNAEATYDFGTIDPFLGTEIKLMQPLNIDRLIHGMKASTYVIKLTECDKRKASIELSRSLQELYYKYIYAQQMVSLATDVKSNLEKAINKVKEDLDSESSDVTQDDLLELRAQMFTIDDGLYQAEHGLEAAHRAITFCIQDSCFSFKDSILSIRTEKTESLDTLKKLLLCYHPDLQRLQNGINAQQMVVNTAIGELLPDAFAVGGLKLSRAIIDKKMSNGTDDLLNPYNNKEGTLGIGLRFNLNYWSLRDKYLKEKNELDKLRYRETYASKGLLLELETQYDKVITYRKRCESAKVSLDNSDALVKSVAIKYDLDHSKVKQLASVYEKNVLSRKNFAGAILDYNIAVADLMVKTGLTFDEYLQKANKGF
jgi:outer membrane protein TolC